MNNQMKIRGFKLKDSDIGKDLPAYKNPKSREVELICEVVYYNWLNGGEFWIKIIKGGSTGFEEIKFDNLENEIQFGLNNRSWVACFGGADYERLEVAPDELKRLYKISCPIVIDMKTVLERSL